MMIPVTPGWDQSHDDLKGVGQHSVTALGTLLDRVHEDVHSPCLNGNSHSLTELAVTETPGKHLVHDRLLTRINLFSVTSNFLLSVRVDALGCPKESNK